MLAAEIKSVDRNLLPFSEAMGSGNRNMPTVREGGNENSRFNFGSVMSD